MAFKDQWTPEEDDLLRRCAEQGQSAAAASVLLGELFGLDRTRMAVLGRANRKGIVFRGQGEAQARQKAEASERRKVKAVQTPRPKVEPKAAAAELLRRRARQKVEAAPAAPAPAAPRFIPVEEPPIAAAADNPGVRFLERGLLQCAMPLPGWDQAGPWEKMVCGRPVTFRPGASGAEPTSWCRACSEMVFGAARKKLDIKGLSRIDRNVVRVV